MHDRTHLLCCFKFPNQWTFTKKNSENLKICRSPSNEPSNSPLCPVPFSFSLQTTRIQIIKERILRQQIDFKRGEMEIPSREGEIPIPINTAYGHGHMIRHDPTPENHNSTTSAPQNPSNAANVEGSKKGVKYRECLKNHAAAMGGNAVDGCGEFMPSGEEGSLEALICSACNCHRNFHRKVVEGSGFHIPHLNRVGRKVILGHHKNIVGPKTIGYYPTAQAHQMIMPYKVGSIPSESDEQEDGGGCGEFVARAPPLLVKKRFRTKFTTEQKEKMMEFAEKVGWKIPRQEENVVQELCQEIGIKRRVLKVWMHNNKHNLAKKNPSFSTP